LSPDKEGACFEIDDNQCPELAGNGWMP